MLTVVCFKWLDPHGRYNDRMLYTADRVNSLKRMVGRHLAKPHRFTCVTDDSAGLDADILVRPVDRRILFEAGNRYPKLMIFRPDAGEWLGRRILMVDLDTIVVGPLDPLIDRREDFVAWQDPAWKPGSDRGKFNSSLVLLTAGSHPEVWSSFESELGRTITPVRVPYSDQAWIRRVLGEDHPVWTARDGVLSFKRHIMRKNLLTWKRDVRMKTRLPKGARIVFFHGGIDPYPPEFQARHAWAREHLR